MRIYWVSFFLLTVFVSGNLFAADPVEAQKKAKELFIEGNNYFSSSDFDKAAASFREAYKYKPTWKLWFNIAQADAASGRYGMALDAFESYLSKGKDNVPEHLSDEAIKEIARLRMLVGTLEVDAPDATSLMIDNHMRGETPFDGITRVAVGEHQIILVYNGQIVLDKTVNIRGSLTSKVSAVMPAKSAADNPSVPVDAKSDEADLTKDDSEGQSKNSKGLVAGGVISSVLAAGAIGMGIAFTAKRIGDIDERDNAAKAYKDSSNTDIDAYNRAIDADADMKTDLTLMIVGFSVGGALAVTAAVLFGINSKKKKKAAVAVYPTFNGLVLTF